MGNPAWVVFRIKASELLLPVRVLRWRCFRAMAAATAAAAAAAAAGYDVSVLARSNRLVWYFVRAGRCWVVFEVLFILHRRWLNCLSHQLEIWHTAVGGESFSWREESCFLQLLHVRAVMIGNEWGAGVLYVVHTTVVIYGCTSGRLGCPRDQLGSWLLFSPVPSNRQRRFESVMVGEVHSSTVR